MPLTAQYHGQCDECEQPTIPGQQIRAEDPVRQFRAALGHRLDAHLNTTQAVVALVHAAVTNHGWTPEQLARECGRDLADTYKPGGVITDRLRKAATHPPAGQQGLGLRKAHRGCCEDGWLYDETGEEVRVTKCPGNMTEATA